MVYTNANWCFWCQKKKRQFENHNHRQQAKPGRKGFMNLWHFSQVSFFLIPYVRSNDPALKSVLTVMHLKWWMQMDNWIGHDCSYYCCFNFWLHSDRLMGQIEIKKNLSFAVNRQMHSALTLLTQYNTFTCMWLMALSEAEHSPLWRCKSWEPPCWSCTL